MKKYLYILVFFITLMACVEPFEFEVRTAKNVLVIEATIINTGVKQRIFLSRAANLQNINVKQVPVYNPNLPFRPIDDSRVNPENNASVQVIDDLGNIYNFSELDNEGIYESNIAFAALGGRSYQLQITTNKNEYYESSFRNPVGISQINGLYAERTTNDLGEEGMAIFVDGSDSSNSSDYFRYTYEETYKIIAPNWTPVEFEIVREVQEVLPDGTRLYPAVNIVSRAQEEQVCYKTVSSTNIKLVSTAALEQSVTERSLIRFIKRTNPILSHRYSILVKQYILSTDTYSYYQNLSNFTKNESVFSEVQPGFLEGNIKPSNSNNLVVGYFDVASVSEKRLYFNYQDFFAGEDLPPYFFEFNCNRLLSPRLGDPDLDGPPALGCPQGLITRIKLGLVEYVGVNGSPDICEGPYYVTPRICGDCTILGSNVKPDFWTE